MVTVFLSLEFMEWFASAKKSSFIPVYRRQKAFSPVMDRDKQGWERLFCFCGA
jgi:hypothetical protein